MIAMPRIPPAGAANDLSAFTDRGGESLRERFTGVAAAHVTRAGCSLLLATPEFVSTSEDIGVEVSLRYLSNKELVSSFACLFVAVYFVLVSYVLDM